MPVISNDSQIARYLSASPKMGNYLTTKGRAIPDHIVKTMERRANRPRMSRGSEPSSNPMQLYGNMLREAQFGTSQTSSESLIYEPYLNPLIDKQHLEFPADRQRQNQRFWDYFLHDPLLSAGIRLLVEFPLSNFKLVHDDPELEDLYNEIGEELDLLNLVLNMGIQYYVLGEVLPFGFVDNPQSPRVWTDFILLNPDWAIIHRHPVARPVGKGSFGKYSILYAFYKEPGLRKIINDGPHSKATSDLFRQIPIDILNSVKSREYVKLPDVQCSYFPRIGNYFTGRGESIIKSCILPMMYRDKLRAGQYTIVDRHITPTEFYMVGETGQPATADELEALDTALQGIWNGPNKALVWHHALKIQFEGASGRILPLQPEFQYVEQQVLTALGLSRAFLYGEGPCIFGTSHDILTERGWLPIADVPDGVRLVTYDRYTGESQLQHFINRIVKDFDGEMIHFETNKIDLIVTPNHGMLAQKRQGYFKEGMDALYGNAKQEDGRFKCVICSKVFDKVEKTGRDPKTCSAECKKERARRTSRKCDYRYLDWIVYQAEELKEHDRLPVQAFWKGDGAVPLEVIVGEYRIPLREYLRFAGWLVTEGWMNEKQFGVCQAKHQPHINIFYQDIERLGIKMCKSDRVDEKTGTEMAVFVSSIRELAQHFSENWGSGAYNKKIPQWVKNLPPVYLRELIDTMVLGDGNGRNVRWDQKCEDKREYTTYFTVSPQLADDVQEIVWKTGRAPIKSICYRAGRETYTEEYDLRIKSNYDLLTVSWSDSDRHGLHPNLESKKCKPITKMPHKGKVYCYEVPSGFIVVRHNGKICITSNTYANASIALEVLIARFITFRQSLEQLLLKQIFSPMCIWNGLYKECKPSGLSKYKFMKRKRALDLPRIKWDKENLREDRDKINMLSNFAKEGSIPWEIVWKSLNLDPKEMTKKLRDQLKDMPGAANILMGSKMGKGLPGEMPPIGGGGGGGEGVMPETLGTPADSMPDGGLGEVIPPESHEEPTLPTSNV